MPLSDAALAQAVVWHRQVAAMVEAADRAGVAAEELPSLRAELTAQAVLLGQAASRNGAPLPALMPTPAEVASAGANLGDLSATAVSAATRTMRTTLAAVQTALTGPETGRTVSAPAPPTNPPTVPHQPSPAQAPTTAVPGGRVLLRNAGIYGAYAGVVLVVQAILFLLLDESSLPAAAPLCLLILPAFAWAAGWLTIGALFAPGTDGTLDRSVRAGVLVCMIPNVLLCAGVGVLFLVNRFS